MKKYSLPTRKGRTEEGRCKKKRGICIFPVVATQLSWVHLEYEARHKLALSSGGQPITGCENVPTTKTNPDACHWLNKPQVKQTTVINDVKDKPEEIRAKILATNKAYSSLQTIFWSKQIHQNNKIRLYITLIEPILCYGSVTWTLIHTSEQMLNTFERKILRRIYGPTHEGGYWRPRWNNELYSLYKEPNIVEGIKIRRLE
jgi:hypothetical protein